MAIAFDSASSGSEVSGNATSLTVSHTCSGNDRILIVATQAAGDILTSITYNGVAMVLFDKQQQNGNSTFVYLHYLLAPTTGAHDIAVNMSSQGNIGIAGASYTGVLQSSQPDASVKNNTTGATLTLSPTVVANNCWLIGAGLCANGPFSHDSPRVTRAQGSANIIGDSNGVVATGSQSIACTSPAGPIAGVAVSIVPAPEPLTSNDDYMIFLAKE